MKKRDTVVLIVSSIAQENCLAVRDVWRGSEKSRFYVHGIAIKTANANIGQNTKSLATFEVIGGVRGSCKLKRVYSIC